MRMRGECASDSDSRAEREPVRAACAAPIRARELLGAPSDMKCMQLRLRRARAGLRDRRICEPWRCSANQAAARRMRRWPIAVGCACCGEGCASARTRRLHRRRTDVFHRVRRLHLGRASVRTAATGPRCGGSTVRKGRAELRFTSGGGCGRSGRAGCRSRRSPTLGALYRQLAAAAGAAAGARAPPPPWPDAPARVLEARRCSASGGNNARGAPKPWPPRRAPKPAAASGLGSPPRRSFLDRSSTRPRTRSSAEQPRHSNRRGRGTTADVAACDGDDGGSCAPAAGSDLAAQRRLGPWFTARPRAACGRDRRRGHHPRSAWGPRRSAVALI